MIRNVTCEPHLNKILPLPKNYFILLIQRSVLQNKLHSILLLCFESCQLKHCRDLFLSSYISTHVITPVFLLTHKA